MANLYVIRDDKMEVDVFVFLQQQDGAAGSYFYNWALMQQHRDFSLHSIGKVEYSDVTYGITSADRVYICNMPEEVD
ncbi:hypothetical protein [Enterobacter ludwigii]|uniref:hypothetical protein n=1 Tax=Enterobacter ludwigii TaxID=299767 RepID=UPI001BE0A951|nr:hypothetical protein [Enterobacter ludwigii]MBT1846967.1 hypothetical protein [Enterobacter ludwigii]